MDAMVVAFPVTRKILGEDIFESISVCYVRIYPPTSPILMFYGDAFPSFIEASIHVEALPYLADIARLELARRQSYHAADTTSIAPNRLAEIAPEDLVHQRFTLSPAMRLVPSTHPIVSIWAIEGANAVVASNNHSETALLTRPEYDVSVHKITPETRVFLSALANASLGAAYDAALTINAQFDLSAAVKLLLDHHLIIDINRHA
jgi:hypothetical protein